MSIYFSKLNNLKYYKAKLTPLVDSLYYSQKELNSLSLKYFQEELIFIIDSPECYKEDLNYLIDSLEYSKEGLLTKIFPGKTKLFYCQY